MKLIELTQGKFTAVDDEDYDRLSKHNWYAGVACGRWYAQRIVRKNGKRTTECMHRVIMNTPSGMTTDHINGDSLNNQKNNLRICTHQQNLANKKLSRVNTSGFKGVSLKQGRYWEASIKVRGKNIYLGNHKTPKDAAKAYDSAARKHFGEFARLNFP